MVEISGVAMLRPLETLMEASSFGMVSWEPNCFVLSCKNRRKELEKLIIVLSVKKFD
jgi:hypothetical protein